MQKELIVKQIRRVFNGPAWHGPSVMEVLSEIKENHTGNAYSNSHSIIELIGHMIAWRRFVIDRLKGNDAYDVSDDMNFPKPTNLQEAIEEIKSTQEELLTCISTFSEARLPEKVFGKPYSNQTMLHGILHHDLYHLGQISLLNR